MSKNQRLPPPPKPKPNPVIEKPESEPTSGSAIICSHDAYNCGDFKTHAEAQKVFETCGGIGNDIHGLDRNKDGVACESLR